jgi:Ca2+-binding RTX toxin-like protein
MASSTFPNATNTGVPSGTTLTAYTGPMTITQDGTVVDGKIINGTLTIQADNVVIKNSKVTFNGSWGIDAGRSKNLTIQDSDIIGPGYSGNSNSAIRASGTFLRNDISKVQNGIAMQGGASVVKGNYIHDLECAGNGPHYDGIEIFGSQRSVLIEGNTILARNTSNILISDLWGAVSDVTIRNNFLGGSPGYNIYVTGDHGGGTTGVVIENNQIAKGGYGYYYIYKASPTISGNGELPAGTQPGSVSGGGTGGGGTTNPDDGGTTNPGGGSTVGTTHAGTDGDDVMPAAGQSNSGNEKFYGKGGQDVLLGGAGADLLDGGYGNDTASYAGSNAGVTVNLQTGAASGGHAAGDTFVGIENLTGSSYADKLYGNAGANVLNGGAGADYLSGGAGDDTYVVDNVGDTVAEAQAGGNNDTVLASVSFTLGTYVNNLTLTGTANLNATGNMFVNVLRGNAGRNTLNGQADADTLIGGLGNDVLTGGVGKDTFVFDTALSATANVDRITDFSVVDDVIHLDNAVFKALTTTGNLSSADFVKNTSGLARDANDHIVYETDTGKLFYDSNGSASGGSVHFATLNANLALTAADFVVI